MKRVMVLLRLLAVVTLLASFMPVSLVAADTIPALIISEIKIRNDTAGLDEYIELYNPSTVPVSLNDYFLAYINSPAPTDSQVFAEVVIGAGLLEPGDSFVLANNEADPNLPLAMGSPFASLSDSGGTLRILDDQDNIVDQFVWSSTASLAIAPVQHLPTTTAAKSQSFTRNKDLDGQYVLVDPQWELTDPSPQSSSLLPQPLPDPEPDVVPTPDVIPDTETPPPEDTNTPPEVIDTPIITPPTQPVQITELLPNPASPASDSTDEFIELYNPNDQPVDLTGYKLQSGNTFSYSYTFVATSLGALQYKAFLVTETGDILSNSGGQARLLDPLGVVIAQTNAYDAANDGDAWALITGAWQWTTMPTPNAANELALPVLKVISSSAVTTKKATAKTAAKTKTSKSTAKVAAAKTTKAATPERQVYEDPAEVPPSIHPGILAGVGVITLVYALYEYRYDALNALKRFQRYRAVRRATRPQSIRR